MQATVNCEQWPLRLPFVIARETMTVLPLVHLRIEADNAVGHAEAAGVDYRGETAEQMASEIAEYLHARAVPPTRADLLRDLPAGGARNAIDCALWDWEAKRSRRSAASLATMPELRPLETVYTLSLDEPEAMAAAARTRGPTAALKLKLGSGIDRDVARVAAVRAVTPKARLLVDVNEGWSVTELGQALPMMAKLGVELIEQPVAAGIDLSGIKAKPPLCADESFNDLPDLDDLAGYGAINIKLDKCGGLTAALAIVAAARVRGLKTMVGSMLGTSLGMAPAFLVGQSCDWVDLDGPLLLARDRPHAMRYAGALVAPPERALWG